MSEKAGHAEGEKKKAVGGGGMMGHVKVAGIIAVIVLTQCAFAYFLIPAAPTVAADAKKTTEAADETHGEEHNDEHAKKDSHDEHADEHGDAHDSKSKGKHGDHHSLTERREVDLGRFSITSYDQTTSSTMLIDFHLFGAVLEEPKKHDDKEADAHGGGHGGGHGAPAKPAGEPEDDSKFGKLMKKNKHRFRDQVIVIVRNSSPADLADPALGLIKRQILAKTNSLLGEPLLKEVVFSEFSVVQQ